MHHTTIKIHNKKESKTIEKWFPCNHLYNLFHIVTFIFLLSSMKTVNLIALILIIVGALNWGLVWAFGFNLVDAIFGVGSVLARIVYIVVGLSAIWYAIAYFSKK